MAQTSSKLSPSSSARRHCRPLVLSSSRHVHALQHQRHLGARYKCGVPASVLKSARLTGATGSGDEVQDAVLSDSPRGLRGGRLRGPKACVGITSASLFLSFCHSPPLTSCFQWLLSLLSPDTSHCFQRRSQTCSTLRATRLVEERGHLSVLAPLHLSPSPGEARSPTLSPGGRQVMPDTRFPSWPKL